MLDPSIALKYFHAHNSAMKRNKEFDLSIFYLKNILEQKHCAYSGKKFVAGGKYSLSLERIDNDKGYIDGNVIPVCFCLNSRRGNKTDAELASDLLSIKNNKHPADVDPIWQAINKANRLKKIYPRYSDLMTQYINSINRSRIRISNLSKYKSPSEEIIKANKNAHNKIKTVCALINSKYAKHITVKEVAKSEALEELTDLNNGLKKFRNLSKLDKMKISVGLPVSASLLRLLKTKIIYNLIRGTL